MMRGVVILCSVVAVVLSGCMTDRIRPVSEHDGASTETTFLVKKIEYDEHGRPLFRERLGSRPSEPGTLFTIVHVVNGRPLRSYDVVVVEQKADMGKPLEVLYAWTGKGFEGGLAIAEGIFPGGYVGSGREAAVYLAVKVTPVIIGGVTGFLVGLVASIPETAVELRNVLVQGRETLTGYTVYEYDTKGRLIGMKLYPPAEQASELVRTVFTYADGDRVPVKAEVNSVIEKTVRTIR